MKAEKGVDRRKETKHNETEIGKGMLWKGKKGAS